MLIEISEKRWQEIRQEVAKPAVNDGEELGRLIEFPAAASHPFVVISIGSHK